MNNQQDTKEFIKAFGIFVGLFNRSNNTDISVKSALQQPEMIELYNAIGQACQGVKSRIPTNTLSTSTRRRSLTALNVCDVDQEVLNYIKTNPNSARSQIAAALDKRISTICGAARRLIVAGMIYVSGETMDTETNRQVEGLSARA